jgi:acyl carrier protein
MLERVKKIIAAQLGADESAITPETDLEADLGADSLDAVELAVAFEEEFGITVPDDDITAIVTVGDILEYIELEKQQ